MPTWTAEDLPGDFFSTTKRRPMTDEDAAMSAPETLTRGVSEKGAREHLADHLVKISTMRHIDADGLRPAFLAAAELIRSGGLMAQVHTGRIYRIRKEN